MFARLKSSLPYITAVVLALLIMRPLLNSTWYPMHDTTHIARTYLLEQTLHSGQIPALWAFGINNGYGYPLFQFYAPLVYYLTLAVKMLVGSYIVALKIILFALLVTAGSGAAYLTRRWGSWAATVAAASYMLLPYAAVNIYVRGAFAEYAAMALLPWVFATWEHLRSGSDVRNAIVVGSLFILSHNLIPIMAAPFLAVWAIGGNRKRMSRLFFAGAITLLITAWYWVSLVFERSFVQVDTVALRSDFHLHFVYLSQLWNSVWGYGGSAPGPIDGMSFKIGKVQVLATAGAAVLAIFCRSKRAAFFVGLSAFAAYMTTSYSQIVWDHVPFLPMVQFPWRFLTLVGLGVAVSSGAVVALLPRSVKGIVAILTIGSCFWFGYKYFVPQTTFAGSDSAYTSSVYLATVANVIPEYMPRWMPETPPQAARSIPKTVTGPGWISLPRAYYPTWFASLDNTQVTLAPDSSGLIALYVPTGSHTLTLWQGHTTLEWVGLAVSAVTLIWLYAWWEDSEYV